MTAKKRVAVTGISMISANGNDKDEFLKNAMAGCTGIKKTDLFPTMKLRTDYFGQIQKPYIYEVKKMEDKSRLECIFDDLVEALSKDCKMSVQSLGSLYKQVGFSFATSVGTNDYITAHVQGTIEKSISKSNLYKLPSKLGINGPVFVNTSACAAGTTAIGTAYSLVASGKSHAVIAGGIDPLTEFSSYGFHSLQSLSVSPCKPFDKKREGITLGEGGALFLIEDYEKAKQRGAYIYAEISGYGLGNDAYHATSPDPTGAGAKRVMDQALIQADLNSGQIDYINAHGTGTLINDAMEVKAVEKLKCACCITSTKSQVGHCLAAAGAIEFAATILSLDHQVIFPNVNLDDPIEADSGIEFVRGQAREAKIDYALSNSFAFAGNAASVVVRRPQ